MLEQKTIQIGGTEILIQQLGTSLALKHSVILGQLFGGLSQGIESKGKDSVADWNIDFGKTVDGLLSRLDPEKSPVWIYELVQQSVIKPDFTDTWFQKTFSGELENLLLLLKAILEHNYGGLLEYVGKKIQGLNILATSSGSTNPKN